MDIFSIYIAIFFIVFLIMPITYLICKFILWFLLEYCGCSKILNWNREQDQNLDGEQRQARRRASSHWGLFYDRQGNIFTISDETSGNTGANRYPDFFYLEPSSDEAARIRAQLEKDDKDLPSYDDVIRMTSLPATPITPTLPGNLTNILPPATPTSSNLPLTVLDMTVPPYSEVDPNSATTSSNITPTTASAAVTATAGTAASTSRGASVAIPVSITASSTIV